MASAPGDRRLEFFVRVIPGGAMGAWLSAVAPGDRISLRGPFGAFYRRDDATVATMVAGGTGLAPILSMLRTLPDGSGAAVRIVVSVEPAAAGYGVVTCYNGDIAEDNLGFTEERAAEVAGATDVDLN